MRGDPGWQFAQNRTTPMGVENVVPLRTFVQCGSGKLPLWSAIFRVIADVFPLFVHQLAMRKETTGRKLKESSQ